MSGRLSVRLVLSASLLLVASALWGAAPGDASNANIKSPVRPPDDPPRADPVGAVSGTAFDGSTDIRVPCPDIDLVFHRSYDSVSTEPLSLGYGWTHAYEWYVETNAVRICLHTAGEDGVTAVSHEFPAVACGGSAVIASGYRIVRGGDGLLFVVAPDMRRYDFNSAGRLVSITTWNGTRVSVVRSEEDGWVTRAVHSCGKGLGFHYGEGGLLVRVTTPDPSVRVECSYVTNEWVRSEDLASAAQGLVGSGGLQGDSPVPGSVMLGGVVRHDGDRTSAFAYDYLLTPHPGVRSRLPEDERPASEGAGRSSAAFAGGGGVTVIGRGGGGGGGGAGGTSPGAQCRPPRYAMLHSVLADRVDPNGIAATYDYERGSDCIFPKCCRMSMSGGLLATDFGFQSGKTEVRRKTAYGDSVEVLSYDEHLRVTSSWTGGEGVRTTYDGNGDAIDERMQSGTGPVVFAVSRSFDASHRVVESSSAFNAEPGRRTRLGWDERRGILNRVVSPEGRVREWVTNGDDVVVYGAGARDARLVTHRIGDANGHVRAVLTPDGGRTDISYDRGGYVSGIATEGLPPASFSRNALGHVSSVALPGPEGTTRTVSLVNNWRGKPLSTVHPDGTSESFAYDGNGTRVVRHVDALGREDVYRWVLGLPVHAGRVIGGVTNALFSVSHDQQLNVVAITDPLGRPVESYVLDLNERVVAATNLEGQVMTRTYALGKMVASETRFDGTSVAYGYDSCANLASLAYPDDTLRFGYDRDGLMTSAANSSGVVSNRYDAATGWLDSSVGVDGFAVSYLRSNGGSVTGVVSAAGTVRHVLDVAGRRVRTDSPAGTVRFGHCPWNGLVAAVTNVNGVTATYAYDVMNRVTNIAWRTASGSRLGGFAYRYDALGRIVSRAHDLGGASFDRDYAYDGMDRLDSDGGTAYAYDAAGNRMTRTEGGETVTYALGQGDRLATWTGGSYRYDAAGCVTRITRGADTWDLTWNGQYQLVSVSTNGAFSEAYAYDALGRRVTTRNAEGTERHVYDDSWQVIADLDASGNVIRSYVWGEGIDRLLAVKIGARTYTALTDVQGTVWGYADEQGDVVAKWTYDAWGNVLSEEVDASVAELRAVRYRFQVRERSAATGLTNFRMRWYDAVTGRWLSKDPIGLSGGLNLYAFCGNDSINYMDPTGLGKVGFFVRTVKGSWHLISRTRAAALIAGNKTIRAVGSGARRQAKRLIESVKGKRVVRHDGHRAGELSHMQPKNGGGAHVQLPGAHIFPGTAVGTVLELFNPIADVEDVYNLLIDAFDDESEDEGILCDGE